MKLKNLIPLSVIGLIIGCSPSTKLVNTWVDPSLAPGSVQPFKNVLVIARIKDATSNRVAEDKIVSKLNMPASPSYAFLLPSDTNTVAVDEKLKKAGFDGLVAMRLTDVDQTLNYQQGSGGYYGGYYGGRPGGYYGYYGTPGYYTEDRTFYVETSIFSLVTGKLMWSGTTASLNPTQLDATLDEIIYAIRADLTKRGLIKDQSSKK